MHNAKRVNQQNKNTPVVFHVVESRWAEFGGSSRPLNVYKKGGRNRFYRSKSQRKDRVTSEDSKFPLSEVAKNQAPISNLKIHQLFSDDDSGYSGTQDTQVNILYLITSLDFTELERMVHRWLFEVEMNFFCHPLYHTKQARWGVDGVGACAVRPSVTSSIIMPSCVQIVKSVLFHCQWVFQPTRRKDRLE